MERIYADNAGTSFPKPPEVTEAMVRFARECGVAAGRGSFAEARQCHQIMQTCRGRARQLLNAAEDDGIVFTLNCSDSLNIVIRGLLALAPRGTHAVATAMEHNSILRPLHTLAEQVGTAFTIVPCDPATGIVDPDDIRRAIRPETKLIACAHASNVTGCLAPVKEVAAIARERGIACVIDAAQSAGHVPIDVQQIAADYIAFPGHKGLLGPLGTGMLYIRKGAETKLNTIKEGGTGSLSEVMTQPQQLPEKLEIGSPNAIGIAGLSEGLAWLLDRGVANVRKHDQALGSLFLGLTREVPGLKVYGSHQCTHRLAVFTVEVQGVPPMELAERLESGYGVLTRAGLHCAPLAHKTIGTFPRGACRLSFGVFNTEAHVRHCASALREIAAEVVGIPAAAGARS